MAMVCPQCNKVYERQERRCDQCNVPLLFYAGFGSVTTGGSQAADDVEPQWQQTPWGRIVAGLVLAQGLAYGLQQSLTAAFLARGEHADLWSTLLGLAVLHALHGVGLIAGGVLAGAGQHRGTLYGSLVGLCSGFIFLFLQRQASTFLTDGAVYAQPFVHMVVGGIGGLAGKIIWKPTPRFTLPEGKGSDVPLPPAFEMRWLEGPIHWWRISAGSVLVVCGVIWSNLIMKWMLDYSQGTLNITTHFQARVVGWEISGLAILLGALFAGATTYNGAKQGLGVGIGASIMFVGFQVANPRVHLEAIILVILTMVALALLGGWFGSQLFPPVSAERRRRRIVDG
jgi:hypothetical protein